MPFFIFCCISYIVCSVLTIHFKPSDVLHISSLTSHSILTHFISHTFHISHPPYLTLHISHTSYLTHSISHTLHISHTPYLTHFISHTLHISHTSYLTHSISHTPYFTYSISHLSHLTLSSHTPYLSHTGSVMEHWLKDESVDNCMNCKALFNVIDRKHHCRDCGKIFCNKWGTNTIIMTKSCLITQHSYWFVS